MNYKFRAWDKEANIMIYSDHRTRKLYDVYYGFEMNAQGELECRWEGEFTESHVLDGGALDNLMQSTGRHDRDQKEIYDGDVVLHNNELFIIRRDEGCCWLENKNSITPIYKTYEDELTLLGNIYANPELLGSL